MKIKIRGYECEVSHINDYARGPSGCCAFCDGDPCNERPSGDTANRQYEKDLESKGSWLETCPCCGGAPT